MNYYGPCKVGHTLWVINKNPIAWPGEFHYEKLNFPQLDESTLNQAKQSSRSVLLDRIPRQSSSQYETKVINHLRRATIKPNVGEEIGEGSLTTTPTLASYLIGDGPWNVSKTFQYIVFFNMSPSNVNAYQAKSDSLTRS